MVVSPSGVARDYRAHRGIGNAVDADMGLQSADTIKFRFRKHFGTAFERSNACTKAVVIKKDLLASKEPAAYLPEDGNRNGGDEAYHRKTGRIESIRSDHGDKRAWCCLGGGQAVGSIALACSILRLQFNPSTYFSQRARGYLEPVDGMRGIARHE